jgi:hypothetical protein
MATIPRNHLPLRRLPADSETRKAYDEVYQGFLSDVHGKLVHADANERKIHSALDDLFLALREHRQNATAEEWAKFIERCRQHPLKDVLHQDPFTCRAYSKPRGYAGDAELLDFIYGREELWPAPEATRLGASIFNYTTLAPAAAGVRARRGFLADLIDQLADSRRGLTALSLAAGHLREAELAAAVRRRRLGRFVALDADEESLSTVQRCYGRFGVETVAARISRLLGNRLNLGQFDLVYSLGLFDYLDQPLGRRLVSRMFEMLRPEGSLVVANFMPSIRDVGYMETFMDWRLIYRTRREMIELTMEIPEADICRILLFAEETHNIIFLQVTRSG